MGEGKILKGLYDVKLVAGGAGLESALQVKNKCDSEAPLRKRTDNLTLLSGVLAPQRPLTCTRSSLWEQGSWRGCGRLGAHLVQLVHSSLEQLNKAPLWVPYPHRCNLQLSKHVVIILPHYQKQLFPGSSHPIFFPVLYRNTFMHIHPKQNQSNILKQSKFGMNLLTGDSIL